MGSMGILRDGLFRGEEEGGERDDGGGMEGTGD